MTRVLTLISLLALVGLVAWGQTTASAPAGSGPATATASGPTPVQQAIVKLGATLQGLQHARNQEEYVAAMREAVPQFLKGVEEIEKQFPDAAELDDVRLAASQITYQLAVVDKSADMAAKSKQFAQKVLDSSKRDAMRLRADAQLTLLEINTPGAATTQPAEKIAEIIKAFMAKYAKTDLAAEAALMGRQLAGMAGQRELFNQIEDQFIKDFPDRRETRLLLRARGISPDVGKPFKAELTTLDGKKLTLPDDLKGKVVLISFWATWCGPCIREIPALKEVYKKYKDQGVEFVGISLDKDPEVTREKVAAFVKENGLDWVQTYSGKFWDDPTAMKYDVGAIPAKWLIGKDGNVITDQAVDPGEPNRLTDLIDQALGKTTSKPTTSAAAMQEGK